MAPMKIDKSTLFSDLGYEPHPGQELIHASNAARRIAVCGVRFGKTICAAHECIAEALAPRERGVGWIVAPTYDLADRVFREVELIALTKLKRFVKSYQRSERRIVFANLQGGTTEIRAKSADNPVSLLGEGLDFLVVDEAARLQPRIWQSHLAQRLVDRKGWALLISTPHGRGWLYDMYRLGQGANRDPAFESWNLPSWKNPLLDREVIEKDRAVMPERVFAQEYGAQFVEGAGAVFRGVRDCATGEWSPPREKVTYYAGLDLAKVEDYTVLVIMDRVGRVVFVDRFHRIDWSAQVTRIAAAARRYNSARVMCDVTGVGDPVYELLRKNNCMVQSYVLNARSKSQLVDNLTMMFEHGTIVLPKPQLWPDGIEELEAFEYSMTDQGHIRSGAPSGMHDDCVIALGLAALQVSRPPMEVRVSSIRRRW
jgi:hypothetical protein